MRAFWLRLLPALYAAGGVFLSSASLAAPDTLAPAELPPEARQVLSQIRQGGPFAYARDGIVFGNFERRLPAQPRGYYREYTVKTPGDHSRGARRIIAGGQPPKVFYYTADHYQHFQRIED